MPCVSGIPLLLGSTGIAQASFLSTTIGGRRRPLSCLRVVVVIRVPLPRLARAPGVAFCFAPGTAFQPGVAEGVYGACLQPSLLV